LTVVVVMMKCDGGVMSVTVVTGGDWWCWLKNDKK
jgi:hypothetical protein